MCSQPPVSHDDGYLMEELLQAIPLMSADTPELGITGGEPTLLHDNLIRLITSIREHCCTFLKTRQSSYQAARTVIACTMITRRSCGSWDLHESSSSRMEKPGLSRAGPSFLCRSMEKIRAISKCRGTVTSSAIEAITCWSTRTADRQTMDDPL